MSKQDILHVLDKSARNYEFPILDNMNFDMATCRLTAFTEVESWAILFEVVGVNPNLFISNDLYVYTNQRKENGLYIGIDDLVTFPGIDDLFDDDDNFLVYPHSLNLFIGKTHLQVDLTNKDYTSVGIDPHPFSLTKLARWLCKDHKNLLFLTVDEMIKESGLVMSSKPFYQTEQWKHTDEELPSLNEFFTSLADAMAQNDASLIKNSGSNTHWAHWTWSDFDNQDAED
ncbi:hypothetical protein CN918_28930 [Priestia megaterium]|nr:hypothetical protein CN918_28930 [Priestia megaterium]